MKLYDQLLLALLKRLSIERRMKLAELSLGLDSEMIRKAIVTDKTFLEKAMSRLVLKNLFGEFLQFNANLTVDELIALLNSNHTRIAIGSTYTTHPEIILIAKTTSGRFVVGYHKEFRRKKVQPSVTTKYNLFVIDSLDEFVRMLQRGGPNKIISRILIVLNATQNSKLPPNTQGTLHELWHEIQKYL